MIRILNEYGLCDEVIASLTGARVDEVGELGPEKILDLETGHARERLFGSRVDEATCYVVVALLEEIQVDERTGRDQDPSRQVRHGSSTLLHRE